MKPVRTRFAPSPTGFLHVGGLRTALFAWLVARQAGGKFILRFEDTDVKREVEGARQHIIDSLKQLGLDYDEGPDIGGPFAPYTQSERLDHYKKWGQKLIAAGRAYADPYTSGEVQAFREQAQAAKQPFLYRNNRPDNPVVWDGRHPLRFKSDPKPYQWHDAIMGNLSTGPEVIDDFILIKSDGYPTYNFAHIIDDSEMEVSHVIRGQEFIASVPNYLNLHEALGLTPPLMATAPPVLGPDGRKKLSKRDGAKDILDYLRDGFLAEAMVNFIASLGWNDGSPQEIFSRRELLEKFRLDRIQRGGAQFDEQRLLWMNGHYIRELSLDDLYPLVHKYWPPEARESNEYYKKQALGLVQERLKYFAELPGLTRFLFVDLPVRHDLISQNKQLRNFPASELAGLLKQTKTVLQSSDFTVDNLTAQLNQLLLDTSQKPAVLFSLIRIATTQAAASPGLAETLSLLGKQTSLARVDTQLGALEAS